MATRLGILAVCGALMFGLGEVRAGALEDGVKSRWMGAWILVGVETYSLCDGTAVENVLRGDLVQSRAAQRFERGELGRVERIDVKKNRIALRVSFAEPLRVPYQDGPFTLFREAGCAIDLQVELPREALKAKDVATIDRVLAAALERHATRSSAESSEGWNQRRVEPFPEDYDRTVAAHARWQAEQHNAAVRARLDSASAQTAAIAERIRSDPPYLEGFARGVQDARQVPVSECGALLAVSYGRPVPWTRTAGETPEQIAVADGYRDGRDLVLGLAALRGLPNCRIEPPAQASEVASAVP